TCWSNYPGTSTGGTAYLIRPVISAFPERVIESAYASSFSRLAQRSLPLRPAHSRCHQFVTRYPKASDISSPPCLLRLLPAGAIAGWCLHSLESAALSRRTPRTEVLGHVETCLTTQPWSAVARRADIQLTKPSVSFGNAA